MSAVDRFTSPDALPELLTVDEVAAFLNIGRSLAYQLTRTGRTAGRPLGPTRASSQAGRRWHGGGGPVTAEEACTLVAELTRQLAEVRLLHAAERDFATWLQREVCRARDWTAADVVREWRSELDRRAKRRAQTRAAPGVAARGGCGMTARADRRPSPAPAHDGGDYRLTEAGAAERFAGRHADDLRFDHQQGRWYHWCGHHWAPDVDGATTRAALHTVREWQREALDLSDIRERTARVGFALGLERHARLEAMLAVARCLTPLATGRTLGC